MGGCVEAARLFKRIVARAERGRTTFKRQRSEKLYNKLVNTQRKTSHFQVAIETVEALPPDDQMLLIAIIRQRLIEHRRADLITQVAEAREAYQRGDVHRGSVSDLIEELNK